MEITSVNNDLVKETVKLQQKKYRDKTGKFLLEGRKCVEEAILAGLEVEYIFINKSAPTLILPHRGGNIAPSPDGLCRANRLSIDLREVFLGKSEACAIEKGWDGVISTNNSKISQSQQTDNALFASDNKIIFTTSSVLKKISTTDSAPEIVAVAYKKEVQMPKNAKKVVLLENIKDLGNLGTILRTSVAFGADAVILYGKDCADIYNPKCVRSAVGNLWKIPVVYIENFEELKNIFGDFERVATLPRAKEYLKNFEVREPVLVMFGSEADGLSDELIKFSTKSVKIEMANTVESLNLSVSCAVVLYKLL